MLPIFLEDPLLLGPPLLDGEGDVPAKFPFSSKEKGPGDEDLP
jgi:hypothetical protein